MGHWPWNNQGRMVTAPFSPELRGFFKCKITISSPISCYNRIKPGLGLGSTHNNKWMFAWVAKREDKQAPSDLGAVRLWKHVHILQGIKIPWNHSRTYLHAQTDTHTRVYAFTESFFQAEMGSNGSKMVTVRFFCDDSEIGVNKIDIQNTNI